MKECVTHHHACDCREANFAKLEADLAAARREIDAIKTRFEHECSDVDRIVRAIGVVTAPRTECGSLRVNDIVRHINETLDALAAAHSASVDFSNKYAAAQRELAAYRQAFAECRSELVGSNNLEPPHLYWIERRAAELLAQEGVSAQPQYREPTIEDARELLLKFRNTNLFKGLEIDMIMSLEQLGFVRKVQP